MRLIKIKHLITKHNTTIQNFSYLTLLKIFVVGAPLITYPYLTNTLGTYLYGYVILAQAVVGYCSIIISFGYTKVCARHVSINRNDINKLSEILSSVLFSRIIIWCFCLIIYLICINTISICKEHYYLFLFSFGLTLYELLFPQFYYQGIERMKYITIINFILRTVSICLIFIIVKDSIDYYFVPLIHTISYLIGGACSFYILYKNGIKLFIPKTTSLKYYFFDALPIFCTDIICSIKDRFNYILLNNYIGAGLVVVYDLCIKLSNAIVAPSQILSTVLFPQIAQKKDITSVKNGIMIIAVSNTILSLLAIFSVPLFLHHFFTDIIMAWPIQIYMIVPIILGTSSFLSSNVFVAFGYNKYLLYSIAITTISYLLGITIAFIMGYLDNILSYIIVSIVAYSTELIYRIYISINIINKYETQKH